MAVAWLGLMLGLTPVAHGDYVDDLCRPDAVSPQLFTALVEEAEATGMPPSTLKRLLVKGYADSGAMMKLHQLLCSVVQAEEKGLPPELLFQKLDEGLAKRASLDLMVSVINKKVDDMHFVQQLLSRKGASTWENDNVARLAKALATGLSRKDLTDLFRSPPVASPSMRVVAAEIVAYGGVTGFDHALLDRVVAQGLSARSLTADWTYFIKVIAAARKQGISDQRVADAAADALSRKQSLEDLIIELDLDHRHVYRQR